MKNIIKNSNGVVLILSILLMSLVLFLSLYFLNFVITEKRISNSQSYGAKTYYLAEAGIQEMVWRLKNNEIYSNNFETDPNWTETFTRDNPFGENSGSYTVSIVNSSQAHGEVFSIGLIDVGDGKISQRIVKTDVYRAMGEGGDAIGDNCAYADGNIDISSSIVNFNGGSAYSNNVFNVNGLLSIINVDTDLNAVGNFNLSFLCFANIDGEIYAANYPNGPATEVEMPAVDFDSEDIGSYKNIADIVYSQNDFEDLMWENQNLILNDPITYVEGDVDVKGAQNLTINGLLVVERDFEIGNSLCWTGSRCGRSNITINHTEGQPSGIFAKRKINFKTWSGATDIDGIFYANDQITISSFPFGFNFNVYGGIIGRKLTITSVWQPINISRNEEIIASALSISQFSPIITVEHWEEEY